jgi:sulfoxide reductase heme-binding subunit YedZ
MERKTLILIVAGAVTALLFLAFSAAVTDQPAIWYETRIVGLLSFAALFLTVVIGEVRVLAKNKASFPLFRLHKPIAIFATFLVGLHFIAAANDNFKWGKGLSFTQYLGFSFSNKWLVLLSLGTLAFYLMLLIGLTSRTKAIQRLGFKNWKLIHYLSYVSFIIAYIHSVNLGTDIKTSSLSPVLSPLFVASFLFVVALLLTRMAGSFDLFSDQWEVNLAAIFFILLLGGAALLGWMAAKNEAQTTSLQRQVTALEATAPPPPQTGTTSTITVRNVSQTVFAGVRP